MTHPKLHGAVSTICPDCQLRGVTQAPCKHQLTGGPIGGVPRLRLPPRAVVHAAIVERSREIQGTAPVLLLEGGPLGYTPGAGGALGEVTKALSSLPNCPCYVGIAHVCGEPARPHDGRDMRCTAGHVFAGTAAEHEQARGALAAAERRAPHVQAERAGTRERLRAEVEAAEGEGER